MLRGGSLFYALAIAVVIAIFSSSLLLSAQFSRMRMQRDQLREETIRNAQSGLTLLLSGQSLVSYDEPKDIDLFGRGKDSVWLEKKSWGAFDIIISRSHNRYFTCTKIAAAGFQSNGTDKTALTLADLDKPLVVCGYTKITGDCYLPKSGVQRGYIEGQGFSGDEMVNGEIKISDRFLSRYNDTLVNKIESLFSFSPGPGDSVIDMNVFRNADSISNSFLNRTLFVYDNEMISIGSTVISGQVCIISKKAIRVGRNASIHNALLIAPAIVIDDDVQGDFQAFARDSLITGENIFLHYPSVLGLIATQKSPDVAQIFIGKKTKVMGQAFACNTFSDFRKHVIISTSGESIIYGEIFCSDLIDHKGSVYGDIVCSKFHLKTNSAEYDNHLLNGVINRPKRSAFFASSSLTPKNSDTKVIVQWLE